MKKYDGKQKMAKTLQNSTLSNNMSQVKQDSLERNETNETFDD